MKEAEGFVEIVKKLDRKYKQGNSGESMLNRMNVLDEAQRTAIQNQLKKFFIEVKSATIQLIRRSRQTSSRS